MPRLEEIVDTARLQRAADGVVPFERNEFLERLIVLRETKPEVFASLSRAAQSSLAWYEAAKRRAETMQN